MELESLASAFSSLPRDWLIIAAVALCASVDAWRTGGRYALSVSLGFPIAILLFSMLPHAAFLSGFVAEFSTPTLSAVLFMIVFLGASFLMARISAYWGASRGPFGAILTTIATIGIIVPLWMSIPALATLLSFGPEVTSIFGGAYQFWIVAASYAGLAVARGIV